MENVLNECYLTMKIVAVIHLVMPLLPMHGSNRVQSVWPLSQSPWSILCKLYAQACGYLATTFRTESTGEQGSVLSMHYSTMHHVIQSPVQWNTLHEVRYPRVPGVAIPVDESVQKSLVQFQPSRTRNSDSNW